MSVGIVTFFKANNYGAVLQCYALQKFISAYDKEVFLVNLPLPVKTSTIKQKFRSFLFNKLAFSRFRKDYLPPVSNKTDFSKIYFGSDQVWNPDITKEFVLSYFGEGLSGQKYAYAASFGIENWPNDELCPKITELLRDFRSIGIRESNGIEILKSYFAVEEEKIEHVLDPTLLFPIESYSHLFDSPVHKDSEYLKAYIFNKDDFAIKNIISISKLLNIKPVLLNDMKYRSGIKSIPFPSVSKWLTELRDSKFIITDSFHCMVFAILLGKNFLVVPANINRISRIKSLLGLLGLESRFFSSLEQALSSNVIFEDIDYSSVHEKLKIHRLSSSDFLKKSLL